jgi:nucleotide-binding universal stress UspA family protein
MGRAQDVIMDVADEVGADLIAVGSSRKDFFGALFFGSVTRGLTNHAKQSVLITKEIELGPETRVVFATDLSPYAKRAFDKWVSFGAGVDELHVVHMRETAQTTWEPWMLDAVPQLGEIPMPNVDALQATLEEQYGSATSCVVVDGSAQSDLSEWAQKHGCDLLVIGAQGHGFGERLLLGSTALALTANSPLNLCIIRA